MNNPLSHTQSKAGTGNNKSKSNSTVILLMCTENCTEWVIEIHFMINVTGIVWIRTALERQPEERVPTHHCIVGSVLLLSLLNSF